MNNSTEKEYHLLTTDQILAQMQEWENRADTLYDELVARVRGETRTPFNELAHDELLAESEIAQQEWQDLQNVIVERAQERDKLLASLGKLKLTLTRADFEHIAPEVMQDFLCEKIEWLRTKANGRVKAMVDEIYAIDQLHEKELVEFLLFAENKAKERIACNA